MQVQTSRFGPLEISKEDILEFPEGLLGFDELHQFVLLDDPNDEIFAWLQSCENPGVAFPVLEPELFTDNYDVKLTKGDLATLDLTELVGCRFFTIITIPEDPKQMTANLKAPLVINVKNRKARQCVLQDNNQAIREPIFAKLQQRVVKAPQDSIKSQALDWGVAIPLAPQKNSQDKEL